ncbi:MAG: CPBP family intramembrane metalloprotease [Lachnospiraceae bacterium]|nr:CPBP family intramembrane metalloprotease [Lachnospiraceae bacterium]
MGAESKRNIRYVITAILIAALFIIQQLFSRFGFFVSKLFDYLSLDPDDLFLQVSVHHIIQMLCALALIFIIRKVNKTEGFNLRPCINSKGIKYTLLFCLAITIYYLVIYIVGSFTNTINTYDYELNATNVLGTLGFQLLLSGPSEEVLFRSLPIAVLLSVLEPDSKRDRAIAVFGAAVLFSIAHINMLTFQVSWFQVCYAFVLGMFYGYTFIRSKSVIYPMIMHSMSNVISVGGCYLYMVLFE